MPNAPDDLRRFDALLDVITHLRGPEGCPWDKEQTHQTLTRFAIEEAHEFAEAVERGDPAEIRDELGDVLLQVVLNAEIARQAGQFDIFDVIQGLNEKMVRRHPHVFGNTKAETSAEVLQNWSEIKAKEKANRPKTEGFDVPVHLPALLRAQKIGEKTRSRAFDWTDAEQCWGKVTEEYGELEETLRERQGRERQEAELGDLLFSVVQLARHLGLDAEQALRRTNRSFEERFVRMQRYVREDGLNFEELSPEKKESYWKRAKT